jgi:Fe-S-cluster-containing hydrogenase component 2
VKRILFCDSEKCTGCQICELVCSAVKEDKINPILSRIHLTRFDPLIMSSIGCQFCDNPPCVTSCPREALRATEEGRIEINRDKCTLCGWCIQPRSCPFGAITIRESAIAVCDLCDGEPKCVEYCPKDALLFITRDGIAGRSRRDAVKNLLC